VKIARLVRLEKSDQGFISAMVLDDKLMFVTLEPDDTFMKPGCYECRRFHGEKWPDTFGILVKGHNAVLFHIGNMEMETKGCVLLGLKTGYINGVRAVLESRVAFEAFMEYMGLDTGFTLFVEQRL
jgi:hypothetical protein